MSVMDVLKWFGGTIIGKPLEIIDNQLNFYQQRKNAAQTQQLEQEKASSCKNWSLTVKDSTSN